MIYDLIGTMYTPTGVMLTSDDGFEYPEMTAVDGYHVNALDVPAELDAFIVIPETAQRMFAGREDTVCLKFTDRAEWLTLGFEELEEAL